MQDTNNGEFFDIPVVIFFFKRADKVVEILERISLVRPKKIYLISDGPRNSTELNDVLTCRGRIEENISWPCEIIKNYAEINQGVYDRIGLGAKWVLSLERYAIFLEDDNLPEVSFFYFCREMLLKYENNQRVLWVCGSNYLKKYETDQADYFFTQHMLPCGWASWSNKFGKYYDGEMLAWTDASQRAIKNRYSDRRLQHQDFENWSREKRRILRNDKPNSWDYQMSFTLRFYDLLGIVPKYNQICNIGVDEHSVHGGTTFKSVMTQRFCGLPTFELSFPILHPKEIVINPDFEKKLGDIILFPFSYRLKGVLNRVIKFILRVDVDERLGSALKRRFGINE